jgi:hypothetical protein
MHSEELHATTDGIPARQASRALSTTQERLHRDTVAGSQITCAATHRVDDATDLVARCVSGGQRAGSIEVEIGAADPAGLDANSHFIRLGLRDGSLIQAKGLRPAHHGGLHGGL